MASRLLVVFLVLAAMIEFSGRCKGQNMRCVMHPCERQVGEVKILFSFNFVLQFMLHA